MVAHSSLFMYLNLTICIAHAKTRKSVQKISEEGLYSCIGVPLAKMLTSIVLAGPPRLLPGWASKRGHFKKNSLAPTNKL